MRFKPRYADIAGKTLIYLRDHGETAPRQLARDLQTDATTIGIVLADLEKRGHVRRRAVYADHPQAPRHVWALP